MSRALIVTGEAEADILDGFRSYEEKQLGLGARFLDEIEQSLRRIAPNPWLYQEVEPDIPGGRAYFSVFGVLYI